MLRSKKHLKNLCDGFGFYLLILNSHGEIHYASRLARDLLKINKQKKFTDYLENNAKNIFSELLSYAIKEKGLTNRKLNTKIDGILYTLDFHFFVPKDYLDIVYLYIIPDTEQKLKPHVSVEEKLAVVGRLSDGIAHNLRSPLMILRNIADYMAMVMKMWERLQTCKEDCPIKSGRTKIYTLLEQMRLDIYHNVVLMTDIIDDLRAYNKNDRLNEIVPIDIVKLLKRVIKVLDYNTKLAASVVFIEPKENIPFIRCAPSNIQVVVTNIVENAIEQIIEQKIKNGRVEVRIIQQSNEIVIKIQDNGGGIAKDLLANKLFEPFVTTKKKGGTGLGLHTCFKIIQEHKGNIYAQNIEKGAEFTITLPI